MRTQLTAALALTLAVGAVACSGDPNDPMTWAKQLKDLRNQKEALDHLANMDVERARPAVPALIDLYNDSKRPEFLEALARYNDPRTKPVMVEALDYTDDDFDRATIAAGVLGEMKATDAVPQLIAAAEKPLPIKSRANSARIAAMRKEFEAEEEEAQQLAAQQQARERVLAEDREAMSHSRRAKQGDEAGSVPRRVPE